MIINLWLQLSLRSKIPLVKKSCKRGEKGQYKAEWTYWPRLYVKPAVITAAIAVEPSNRPEKEANDQEYNTATALVGLSINLLTTSPQTNPDYTDTSQ